MRYVMLLTMKPGHAADDVRNRTMSFHDPKGVTILGEYWLPTPDPIVVIVTESVDVGRTFEALSPWYAYFDLAVVPVTMEDQDADVAMRLEAALT